MLMQFMFFRHRRSNNNYICSRSYLHPQIVEKLLMAAVADADVNGSCQAQVYLDHSAEPVQKRQSRAPGRSPLRLLHGHVVLCRLPWQGYRGDERLQQTNPQ